MSYPNTITRRQMLRLVVEADPTFETAWKEWQAYWGHEPNPLYYLCLSDLARHLTSQIERGDTARFDGVFDVIERWHKEGEHYVRKAATIGLLEGLQNTKIHTQTKPSDFEPWLRPRSREQWDKLNGFWSGGSVISDVGQD